MKVTSQPTPPLPGVASEGAGRSGRPLPPVATAASGLTLGQLLQGRMVGVNPAGESLVEIGGRLLTFRSPVALPLGKEVWLEVVSSATPPQLALADKKGVTAELLRLLLPERGAMGKAVAGLTQPPDGAGGVGSASPEPGLALRAALAAVAADGQADPKKLLKLLAAFAPGGHSLPGKASGVPSLLSQLSDYAQLVGQAQPEADKPEAGIVKLAKALELMHNLNQQPTADEQPPLYLAPCFFAGSAGWGEWMFWGAPEQGGEARGAEEQYGLAFYLAMSHLGDLHLQVTVRAQTLQGQFAVATPAVLAHLQSQLPELQGLLEGLGYRPVHLACRLAQRDLLLEFKNDLEQKAALAPTAMVNLVV